MKKIFKTMSFFAILLTIITVGCKKYNNSAPPPATDPIPTAVTSGIWSVTSFTQKTENKTNIFSGIDFTFSSDGKLAATGSASASGTWSSTPYSPGYYGGPASLATFTISLGTSTPFDKLSKSWNVGSQSTTVVQLDNKEPLEDEHITFNKK